MKSCTKLLNGIDGLNRVIGTSVSVLIIVLTILIVVEVTFRYLFSSPTVWGTELTSLIFATYILLGGGYTLLKNDHVRMDMIYQRFSEKGRAMLDLLTCPLALLYCVILVVEGGDMVAEAIASKRTLSSDWAPLMWPWLLALPVGSLLLGLQVISNTMRSLIVAFGQKGGQS